MAGQLEDPEEVSPQMRLHIVDVFSMVDDERAARALLEALDDPAPPVRRAAAMTLGQLQVAEAREPLAALERDDPSYQVRMAARTALQNLEGVESPPKPAPPAPEGPSLEREGHDRDPGRAQ
jgi:HEAT repeat protein